MSEWKSTNRKEKSPNKMNTTLMKIFQQNHCIYHFMGNCNNGSKCNFIHMEKGQLFQKLQKMIQDPMTIQYFEGNSSDILKHIMNTTDIKQYNLQPFLTSCFYSMWNMNCSNIKSNRHTNYTFKFKEKDVVLSICYQDPKMCKKRVMCGLHFDVEFEFKNNSLKIIDLFDNKSKINVRIEKRPIHNKTEEKPPDMNDKEVFPSLIDDIPKTKVSFPTLSNIMDNRKSIIRKSRSEIEKDKLISELKETVSNLIDENKLLKEKLKKFEIDELIPQVYIPELPPIPQYPIDPFLEDNSYDDYDEDIIENEEEYEDDYWMDTRYEDYDTCCDVY